MTAAEAGGKGLRAHAAKTIATKRGRKVVLTMNGVLSWRANALGTSPTGRIPHAATVHSKGLRTGKARIGRAGRAAWTRSAVHRVFCVKRLSNPRILEKKP